MALSRTAVLLLLLPVPAAAVYLTASLDDVSASSQCLPSAEAVRQQFPGSWASWTTHAANHKGEKCWFPVMRESRVHHVEAALRRTAQKLMRRDTRKHDEADGSDKPKSAAGTPLAFASGVREFGWGLRSGNATVSPRGASDAGETADSSFEDRFAASHSDTSVQKPSVIQRMMDPVGAIPNIP
jgi:hypothetical protein